MLLTFTHQQNKIHIKPIFYLNICYLKKINKRYYNLITITTESKSIYSFIYNLCLEFD